LGGIEARADQIEDAAELEVVAHYLSEEGGMRFDGVGARDEVGNGEAGLLSVQAGAGTKPVLRRGWER
jgi:hypothetical protein